MKTDYEKKVKPDVKISEQSVQQIFDRPFFIFGCARSGTSLLSQMLNSHSELAVPYESHLFNAFFPWLKCYGDLSDKKNYERLIDDILSTDVMQDWSPRLDKKKILLSIQVFDFGGIVNAILSSWAKSQNKQRWGEKTPHHVNYWREISNFFPNAKVIHIVRDGRDAALSLLKARFGPKTIYSVARYWVNYLDRVEKVKSMTNLEKYCELKYEDLLENPEQELSKVCNFLDVKYDSTMLEFYKNKKLYRTDLHNQQNLQKPIIRDNTQKWKDLMTDKDIRIFESIAKDKLKKYGYKTSSSVFYLSQHEKFYFRFIENPLKKIFFMLKNQKGHRDAWIRLKIRTKLVVRHLLN